ncbi:hypothetical protein HYH02_002735 [Chlamydomonas schloesseri]|uniref:GH16 domain-containing protein n=1 Tax=Chlamydomonas schloesseri TaxID=2026947 RepID=A0A836BAA4_9CHLO|nr:hypothetical protein HYH02_002735 [Chlamydomonas schloesseri]|eukprot:KAG2452496.1 hypothetical protein HYH02_002735 [Chlamydomonas schloesseri]
MILIFSDEFNSKWRDFGPGKDAKWQALDLMYVNADQAMFRREAVTVKNGRAVLTASKKKSKGPYSAPWGDQEAEADYVSGMLQGWNKFCFTGGYLESRLKLPGDDVHGGFWPAIFTLGNLGRAGYLRSTDGMWPFSYDTCDRNAIGKVPWSDHAGQRINACNSTKGRGASEIDLLEVGVWHDNMPELSTSLAIAPVMPAGLHWLDVEGGVYYPTYSDPTLGSRPNGWAGSNTYTTTKLLPNGSVVEVLMPRPGTRIADSMSATHMLNETHFTDFYVYGFDWKPREYVRWYINGKLIYEINQKGLRAATNSANQSVGERLIPVDPQYININLAMSHSFAAIDPNLPLPASMEIDYIRVYQPKDAINVGCDTPDFPSQDYIDRNVNLYKITLAGYEDFVGDSRVMGPTMEPQEEALEKETNHTALIVALAVSFGCVFAVAGGVGLCLWRQKKQREAASAAQLEAAKNVLKPEIAKPLPEQPQQRPWIIRFMTGLWVGSSANTRANVTQGPRRAGMVDPRMQMHMQAYQKQARGPAKVVPVFV